MEYEKEKRKNNGSRFQWWLLVVGFILGAVAMLIVARPPTSTNTVNNDVEGIELTATYIIEQATATAQDTAFQVIPVTTLPTELDTFSITATAVILQVTQAAEMTSTAQTNP